MREPLCRLTCKNVQWIWTLEQKDAFEKIKAPALKYFRKSDPTQGEGDASKDGLGFLPI